MRVVPHNARGGDRRGMRFLELPLNLLVDTAVAYLGAQELSRLEVAARFVARTRLVPEVARRMRLRRTCWP